MFLVLALDAGGAGRMVICRGMERLARIQHFLIVQSCSGTERDAASRRHWGAEGKWENLGILRDAGKRAILVVWMVLYVAW